MGDGLGLECLELKFGLAFTGSSLNPSAGVLYIVVPLPTGYPVGDGSFLYAFGLASMIAKTCCVSNGSSMVVMAFKHLMKAKFLSLRALKYRLLFFWLIISE